MIAARARILIAVLLALGCGKDGEEPGCDQDASNLFFLKNGASVELTAIVVLTGEAVVEPPTIVAVDATELIAVTGGLTGCGSEPRVRNPAQELDRISLTDVDRERYIQSPIDDNLWVKGNGRGFTLTIDDGDLLP